MFCRATLQCRHTLIARAGLWIWSKLSDELQGVWNKEAQEQARAMVKAQEDAGEYNVMYAPTGRMLYAESQMRDAGTDIGRAGDAAWNKLTEEVRALWCATAQAHALGIHPEGGPQKVRGGVRPGYVVAVPLIALFCMACCLFLIKLVDG